MFFCLIALICADPASELWAADADLAALAPPDRPFQRYLTIHNIEEESRNEARRVVRFAANLISDRPAFVSPIEASDTLLRLDARDYAADPKRWLEAWDQLAKLDSYFGSYHVETLTLNANTSKPVLRLDWFLSVGMDEPHYGRFLGLAEDLKTNYERWRVDVEANTKLFDLEQQEIVVRSRVALGKNRQVVRYRTIHGGWWFTRDVRSQAGGGNALAARNLRSIDQDAGEVIFALPNGLHGYFLVNGEGKRIDRADPEVVLDYHTRRPNRVLRAATSCIGCHLQEGGGLQKIEGVAGKLVGGGRLLSLSKREAQKLGSLYLRELGKLVEADNAALTAAVERCCGAVPKEISVSFSELVYAHEHEPVTMAVAGRELGLEAAALKRLCMGLGPPVPGPLVALLAGIGISREAWQEVYPILLEAKYKEAGE